MGKFHTLMSYARMGIRLGADWRSKWLLATMLARHKIMRALGLKDQRSYQAAVKVGDREHRLHFRAQDIFILNEIFVTNPYVPAWLADDPPQRILDLGAHIGLATLQFKTHWPEAAVYCFEPDPDNFRLLQLNTQGLAGVTLRQEAVGGQSGEAILYIRPTRHSASSLLPPGDRDAVEARPCRVRSLDEIITEIGVPDFCKFDVEGSEFEIFAQSRFAADIRCLVGEIKVTKRSLEDFLALFPRHEVRVRSIMPKMHIVYLWRR